MLKLSCHETVSNINVPAAGTKVCNWVIRMSSVYDTSGHISSSSPDSPQLFPAANAIAHLKHKMPYEHLHINNMH